MTGFAGEGGKGARLADGEYRTLAAFRYALRRFLAFSEEAADAGGLLPQHYQALLVVKGAANGDAVTIAQLAEQLIIKHNSAVGLVDRMSIEGLVTRETSAADHRKVHIRLAAKGTRLLEQLAATHRAELRRIAPELNRLIAFLSRPAAVKPGAASGKPVPGFRKPGPRLGKSAPGRGKSAPALRKPASIKPSHRTAAR